MSFKSKKNACFYINSHTLPAIILTYHVTLFAGGLVGRTWFKNTMTTPPWLSFT